MTSKWEFLKSSLWNQVLKRRGPLSISCIVSTRYIKFIEVNNPPKLQEGTPVCLDIMTDTRDDYEDESANDRKICEMIVPLEELERIVDELRAAVDAQRRK